MILKAFVNGKEEIYNEYVESIKKRLFLDKVHLIDEEISAVLDEKMLYVLY